MGTKPAESVHGISRVFAAQNTAVLLIWLTWQGMCWRMKTSVETAWTPCWGQETLNSGIYFYSFVNVHPGPVTFWTAVLISAFETQQCSCFWEDDSCVPHVSFCSVSLMINHGGNDALTGSSFKPCQCCSGIVSRKEKEDPAL